MTGFARGAPAVNGRDDKIPFRSAPHNLEAEQALLGAILVNNEAHDRVSGFLEPHHFYDPLHQQIYETAAKLIANGKQATPITLKTFFETAEPIDATLTVSQYLGRLAANAATIINARDYGRTIYDLATRRQLILIGEDIVNTAYDSPVDFDPVQQLNEATVRLNSLTTAQPSQLAAVSLGEFLALPLPEHEWILSRLLQQRGIALIYAWRGAGKTWFTLSMAFAISSGRRFLKWAAAHPRGVLYVDGEMPAVGMQERLAKLVGSERPQTFRILSADLYEEGLPDLSTAAGQAAIERILGEDEVLFLDNLSTLCRSGVENEAESWLPVQQWLLRLRRRGKTVVLVHHAGKGNAQRGTSRREDVLDLVLNLKAPDDYNPDEGARFEVRFEKGRGLKGDDKATFEAQLSSDPKGGLLWTWADLADAKKAEIQELKAAGKSMRDIGKELGMSKSAVQRILTQCPAVPSLRDGDRRDTTSGSGHQAGQKAGRAAKNSYAQAKNGGL